MCGGSGAGRPSAVITSGLSPRVRGKPAQRHREHDDPGSIPACAGEAPALPLALGLSTVYPRVCGGSPLSGGYAYRGRGLSPRVRGKPVALNTDSDGQRSIPACAGEANPTIQGWRFSGVYPRVCGGSGSSSVRNSGGCGLSPRVRGKHQHPVHQSLYYRSIPACAGEA